MRWLLLAAVLLMSAGCDDLDTRPDPIPVAEVEVTADGGFLLDGRPVTSERLDRELKRRAADAPNEKLGRTRLQVRIVRAPGVDYDRVQDLQERCQAMGISNVEIPR
jgi:biopolymer transport protein ExbD